MRSPIKEEEYGRSVLVIIDNIIEALVIVNQNGKDEFQKRLSKSSETTINFILFRLSILQDAYTNCSVKQFPTHRTIPLAAFRCGRVSPGLTKRFSSPTTTLFQYWAIIPYIVVPIFLEKPALSPTYIRQRKGCLDSSISPPYMI
jgi:hypothetical protein